jgi:hypothetical protein
MPTGARLIGGLTLGLVGVVLAMLLVDGDPNINYVRDEIIYLMAFVGFLTGWRGLGRRVGNGYGAAIGFGLRAAVTMAIWGILLAAIYEIGLQIGGYAGQGYMVAFRDFTQTIVDIAIYIARWPIIVTGIVLCSICGLVTEYVSRIWP